MKSKLDQMRNMAKMLVLVGRCDVPAPLEYIEEKNLLESGKARTAYMDVIPEIQKLSLKDKYAVLHALTIGCLPMTSIMDIHDELGNDIHSIMDFLADKDEYKSSEMTNPADMMSMLGLDDDDED